MSGDRSSQAIVTMASPTNTTIQSAAGEMKGACIDYEDESERRETENLIIDAVAVNQDQQTTAGGENSDGEVDAFELLARRKRKYKKMKRATPISIALLTPPEEVIPVEEKTAEAMPLPNVRALDYLKENDEICSGFDCENTNLHIDESHNERANPDQVQDKETAVMAEREADLAKEAEQRLDDGLNWLKREQNKELETKMLKHRRDAQEGQLSQNDMQKWNISMAQLKACHQEQIKQFEEKKSKFIEKKKQDVERQIQNSKNKMSQEQEQLNDNRMKSTSEQTYTPPYDWGDKLLDPSFSHHTVASHKRRKISTSNSSFGMSLGESFCFVFRIIFAFLVY